MKIILFDINKNICDEWENLFKDCENVEVINCDFANLPPCDCVVSPANSFGFMDGGIDAVFTRYFGTQLQDRVQKHISEKYYGEQPVGTSFIISTGDSKIQFLAHTPTMTLPQNISETDNVYQSTKAMLIKCKETYAIDIVACSGMGGLTGRVSPKQIALQMKEAYDIVFSERRKMSWAFASGMVKRRFAKNYIW